MRGFFMATEPSNAFERLRRWLVESDTAALAGPDATAVAALAVDQGLAGLLHENVVAAGVAWPREALAVLRAAHHAALARGERQLESARRVIARLAASGLRALPLKGAALVGSVYDSAADRPMGDVDLLALDDFPGALRLLREAGFREAQACDHATALVDPETAATVELHRQVTSCAALFPLDREGLWARRRGRAGGLSDTPAPEDQLLLLALHAAFQHGLVLRLVQFLDFRRLFERAGCDARRVTELAGPARAGAAVFLSLEAAAAAVGCPGSEPLRQALGRHEPPSLHAWLARRRGDPRLLVPPALPDLLRLRWALARGRRATLLREALLAGAPAGAPLARLRHAASRAAALAWRWSAALPR
jgi:hypothetical protein